MFEATVLYRRNPTDILKEYVCRFEAESREAAFSALRGYADHMGWKFYKIWTLIEVK